MNRRDVTFACRAEDVPYEVDDDGGLLYGVKRSKNGILSAQVRVWGHVTIDGKQYEYDHHLRVRLKKAE